MFISLMPCISFSYCAIFFSISFTFSILSSLSLLLSSLSNILCRFVALHFISFGIANSRALHIFFLLHAWNHSLVMSWIFCGYSSVSCGRCVILGQNRTVHALNLNLTLLRCSSMIVSSPLNNAYSRCVSKPL